LKYGRPTRSVTLTLPTDTIAALKSIDADLGQATVKLAAARVVSRQREPLVALEHYGNRAVIVVRPVAALKRLAGIELIPLGDRDIALIALTEPLTIAQFELRVQDALETQHLTGDDRRALLGLTEILKEARRSGHTALAERTIIVLEDERPRR
jgi:hypothetical protein